MRRNPEESREVILGAAESFTKERGAGAVTVEGVARAAGCAKGLVHYHFKTKSGLIESVAQRLASYRETRWREAFDAPSPEEAIDRTWSVLTEESNDGTLRAWTSLLLTESGLTDSTVKDIDIECDYVCIEFAARQGPRNSVSLSIDDEVVRSYGGTNSDEPYWISWEVGKLKGRTARLKIEEIPNAALERVMGQDDRRFVAVALPGCTIDIWDVVTGKKVISLSGEKERFVGCLT